ncbi:DUF1150 family protein [Shimia abyssi]|uniref:DUF1150 family protein n=1 Tax=Shimia abyssi TaxID=1662395 RepID=A0A2P8FER9_9RHOB|nr:DUF1150 family protein [Shimia abyssi]PSL20220.1 hypothetical protein CLV88_104281 [Shimia abyssi]
MNTKYNFDQKDLAHVVYVREVPVADLPMEVQDKVGGAEMLFAVHNSDGERLALVTEREMAFVLAREHNYAPVAVH